MNTNESWKMVLENSKSLYYVSNLGNCKKVDKQTGSEEVSKGMHIPSSPSYLFFANNYVHRHVAMAFIPNPDNLEQVDHINNNRLDNRVQNLRWVTRQQNNSKPHAQKLRSLNSKCTSRKDQYLRAEKDGEVRFFKNGREAAEAIGCSHVLVYRTASGNEPGLCACGWNLTWVPMDCDDPRAKQLAARIEKANLEAEHAKTKKLEASKLKRHEAKQKRRIERINLRIAEKMEHKRTKQIMKTKKEIEQIKKRVAIWEKHLEAKINDNMKQLAKIRAKIDVLKQKQADLETSLKELEDRNV